MNKCCYFFFSTLFSICASNMKYPAFCWGFWGIVYSIWIPFQEQSFLNSLDTYFPPLSQRNVFGAQWNSFSTKAMYSLNLSHTSFCICHEIDYSKVWRMISKGDKVSFIIIRHWIYWSTHISWNHIHYSFYLFNCSVCQFRLLTLSFEVGYSDECPILLCHRSSCEIITFNFIFYICKFNIYKFPLAILSWLYLCIFIFLVSNKILETFCTNLLTDSKHFLPSAVCR